MNAYTDQEIKGALKGWSTKVRPYMTPNRKKAWGQVATTFLPFLTLWVLMYLSLDWSYWITLLLGALNGLFLVRVFIIQHDCGHQSFLKSTRWNNAIGFVCSFFSSIPYHYWSEVHRFHHNHSGQLEVRDIGDIPMLTAQEYEKASPWRKFIYRVFRTPVVLFIFAPIVYLLMSNRFPAIRLGDRKAKRKMVWRQILDNTLLAIVYLGLAWLLGWKKFILVQGPILFCFGVVAFWFFYVQHQHEESYKQWRKNWDYLISAIRGSTYYKLPRIFHWFTGNIGYHHIHHLCSGIPNYNLPKCARENPIFQRFVTSITFKQSLSCINNKLWDEKEQRMVSFREWRKMAAARVAAA